MTIQRQRLANLLRRYPSVVVVVFVGGLLSGVGAWWQYRGHQEHTQEALVIRAADEAARLQRGLARAREVVDSLDGLFAATVSVNRQEFRAFTLGPLADHPEFQALEWLPRVTQSERAAFEAELGHVIPGGVISERDRDGRRVPATSRAEYFPVFYAEPYEANTPILGFDAASRPEARQVMAQARDTGQIVSTGRITLIQGDGRKQAVIYYIPVYRNGLPHDTLETRRANLVGFGVGVLLYPKLLESTLAGSSPTGLDWLLLDPSRKPEDRLLHFHPSRSRAQAVAPPDLAEVRVGLHHETRIELPGREWRLLFRPAPAFHEEFASRWHWAILFSGLSLTGVLAMHLFRRARYSEELHTLANQLNEAQHMARLGRWELDHAQGRLHWSDEVYDIIGIDSAGFGGRYEDFLALVHPDDRAQVDLAYRSSLELRTPYEIEHRLQRPDGEIRIVQERCRTRYSEAGLPLISIGTIQDVTDLRRSQDRLRLAERVFENTQEGIFVADLAGNIIETNPAFSTITGYTREEVVGHNPRLWKSERHDAAFYQTLWRTLLETGQWQGEIWNRRKGGESYPVWQNINLVRDASGKPIHFVAVFTDISKLKQSQAQLAYLAQHDPLTELPNRSLLQDRLQHALARAEREERQLAVMFLDLDHFKRINDTMGHPVGDQLLREVSRRLVNSVRSDDTVARMGGDEFIILVESLPDEQDAASLAGKLLQSLARPYHIAQGEFFVTSSIGISLYPRDGTRAETLISNADSAMYRAKSEGRNTYQYYTQTLTSSVLERLTLEADLRKALNTQALTLHYQPQVNLADGRLIGAEALLRWQHPERGNIPPDQFIPIAEDSGLIIELGEWVLHEACRQAKAWLDEGLALKSIAVNVAGQQIQRSDFAATVRRALERSGLPPEHLELEVTESFIMGEAENAIEVLQAIRQMDVTLSIDDFGTGYSSLAYLKRLPIDKLKVDRSFVRDLPYDEEDAAISRAVIALASSLGLQSLAEGVETAAQVEFLRKLGCAQAQGYFFSKPLPAELFPGPGLKA